MGILMNRLRWETNEHVYNLRTTSCNSDLTRVIFLRSGLELAFERASRCESVFGDALEANWSLSVWQSDRCRWGARRSQHLLLRNAWRRRVEDHRCGAGVAADIR